MPAASVAVAGSETMHDRIAEGRAEAVGFWAALYEV